MKSIAEQISQALYLSRVLSTGKTIHKHHLSIIWSRLLSVAVWLLQVQSANYFLSLTALGYRSVLVLFFRHYFQFSIIYFFFCSFVVRCY